LVISCVDTAVLNTSAKDGGKERERKKERRIEGTGRGGKRLKQVLDAI
jgi:hypothetical protein